MINICKCYSDFNKAVNNDDFKHKMNLFAQELKRFFNAAVALEGIDALRCEMVRSYFNSRIGDWYD